MASPSAISLSTTQEPIYCVPNRTEESATITSNLLQENHEQHHIFFNHDEFHNHIVHHLCTAFALGATASQIRAHYDKNITYQRPAIRREPSVISNMQFKIDYIFSYLGHERHYHSFLSFFEHEVATRGYKAVISEYLFSGSSLAESLLSRMYAGYFHPLIHLGFAIEFEQPALVAEALAQAAVHPDWMTAFLIGTEQAAKTKGDISKTLVELLADINKDPFLNTVADHVDGDGLMDGNKLQYGILGRGAEAIIDVCSQFVAPVGKLSEKTAEMISASVLLAAAAQRPPKEVKFDFYSMHCVTTSIFFPVFNRQEWITAENKARMLEWKARSDLAMYASRRAPELRIEEITEYKPRLPSGWDAIFKRINAFSDDGHGPKLVRALASGESQVKPFELNEGIPIKGDMWLKIGHMAVDSLEGTEAIGTTGAWVRGAGFVEAWATFKDRQPVERE